MAREHQSRTILLLIIAISAVLRVILCAQGGQYFFGDENRFDRAVQLYRAVSHGEGQAVREVLKWPEHSMFTMVGALATAAQRLLALATPYGDWKDHPEYTGFTVKLAACVLSLFSTLNILLVYRLARVMRADREEALWATLLMAASNTALYFSRHLLPYECAVSASLAALVIGLGAPSACRALLCGLLSGAAFHLYNGYWYIPPVAGLVFACFWWGQPKRYRLAAFLGLGVAFGLGTPILIGTLAGGSFYLRTMVAFSGTATAGLFAEGWSLPWEYFWYSEGAFGVAVVACIAFALLHALASRRPLDSRVLIWLMALGAIYACLVLFSVFLGKFVVYARTVIPMVPLFCLAGGWALRHVIAARARLKGAVAAGLALSTLFQFSPHFTRVFPKDVEIQVLRAFGNPKRSLSVSGSLYWRLDIPVTRPDLCLVNAQLIYPVKEYIGYPEGYILLRVENALTYRPYQYESHTPRERNILRTKDISICLIRLRDPAGVPDDLPYRFRYQNSSRPLGRSQTPADE
jgi:hypothetical protein